MTGDELREAYATAEDWRRNALVMKAAFQLDLLYSELETQKNLLRMAHECSDAWRNLYRDSWRQSMRTWVNDKEMYDEEMAHQARRDERRELEARHTPLFTEDDNGVLSEQQQPEPL